MTTPRLAALVVEALDGLRVLHLSVDRQDRAFTVAATIDADGFRPSLTFTLPIGAFVGVASEDDVVLDRARRLRRGIEHAIRCQRWRPAPGPELDDAAVV